MPRAYACISVAIGSRFCAEKLIQKKVGGNI